MYIRQPRIPVELIHSPTSYTTTNELYVSGDWDTWDTDYYTWGVDYSPYDHEVINSYYYFYIYKQ